MQAIILAAGMGRRLGEYTADNTKCMLEVNGERLIDRFMRKLGSLGLSRIVVVTGYERGNLISYLKENYPALPLVFIENDVYDRTNNIYSLWLARDYLMTDDTLLLESDLIFDDAVIDRAIESPYPDVALVAKYEAWMDGTMVSLDEDDNIITFIPRSGFDYDEADSYYKTVNVYKFSRRFSSQRYIPFLEAYIKAMGNNEYYEQVLRVMMLIDTCGIKGVSIGPLKWYEIDDVQDLRIAETIFASPEERLDKIKGSFGGYWRYPGLLDFCYLVNPYFPPRKMMEELKSNLPTLIREYPSGMGVNALLGGKYFGIRREYVCVGNGAAELIKALMERLEGTIGIISPTFEEYVNRRDKNAVAVFTPSAPEFRYDERALMEYFSEHPVDILVLVNPDNPTGNFITLPGLMRLIGWAAENGIRLIVDESFVDFAENGLGQTLLRDEILRANPHLCVVKSISKSYGVPGLRLGVMASGDEKLISEICRDVAIWNINSVAEFYMQIYGKYEPEYRRSCVVYAKERDRMFEALRSFRWLNVVPSAANFILCEIKGDTSARDLQLRLLSDFDILIKDCTGKRGFGDSRQFIRLAVRDAADNVRLINALRALEKSMRLA